MHGGADPGNGDEIGGGGDDSVFSDSDRKGGHGGQNPKPRIEIVYGIINETKDKMSKTPFIDNKSLDPTFENLKSAELELKVVQSEI